MRDNLWDDPRVAKIVDLTDSSEAAVIGALYWLWATADQHTENGIMPGLTLKSINRKTGVQGFAEALCEIGWLADHPEGVRIVDFEKHNGSSAKKRCQTAQRVAKHTAANAKNHKEEEEANAQSVSDALAREEKRREEEELKPSEAIASAVKPPLTPDEIIFGYGVPILTNAGTAEKQARSFLGGLRKAHGDDPCGSASVPSRCSRLSGWPRPCRHQDQQKHPTSRRRLKRETALLLTLGLLKWNQKWG